MQFSVGGLIGGCVDVGVGERAHVYVSVRPCVCVYVLFKIKLRVQKHLRE